MKNFLLLFILISTTINSQSLSRKKINKIKETVVKININGTTWGTGFLVSEDGVIASCFHVIENGGALYRNENTKEIDSISNEIYIEFENKDTLKVSVVEDFLYDDYWTERGISEDFILLAPVEKQNKKYDYLRIGDWKDINEGDIVYTSGYPLSVEERITAIGTFSTKYKRKVKRDNTGNDSIYRIDAGHLDLTINNGNSGGPLIKLNKWPKKDMVVGLISFKLLPKTAKTYSDNASYYDKRLKTLDYSKNNDLKNIEISLRALYNNANTTSYGVSGAVSIDGLKERLFQSNPEK
ncbi:serine protease [Maribacter sp. TH_r10]|uniref:S1 family peptidase n=1 Tax=Maribacter sp. TH_r10 TaxID=3082086 RepID=UPI0029539B89|nr:serine protease [Maribacter sp. TH_r10]MDV7137357.1 serine protease [Maribacter sp. TH_r10]